MEQRLTVFTYEKEWNGKLRDVETEGRRTRGEGNPCPFDQPSF